MIFLGNFAYKQNPADLLIIMVVERLCDREGLGISMDSMLYVDIYAFELQFSCFYLYTQFLRSL